MSLNHPLFCKPLKLVLRLALSALAALSLPGPSGAQPRSSTAMEPQALAQYLNSVRAGGRPGHAGPRAALRHDARLSASAAPAAEGAGLDEALRQSRYRAPRSTMIMLKG
jgi:hypothetical protein